MIKDQLRLILFYVGTILVVYGMPRLGAPDIIIQLIFLLIIVAAYKTRDDIFWFAWYFALVNAPGGLFSSRSGVGFTIPNYYLPMGIGLGFSDLFVVMYIVKTLKTINKSGFVFNRQIWLFISIALVYFGLSFVIGVSFSQIVGTVRMIIPWFWLLIIPRYINGKGDIRRLYMLLVPFFTMAFIGLFYSYFSGQPLVNAISGLSAHRNGMEEAGNRLFRIFSAHFINFFLLVMSLYYLSQKKIVLNRNLLIAITFIGSMSLFLAASRGWILGLLIIFSSFFFISGFGLLKQLLRVIVIVGILMIIITNVFPMIFAQGSMAFQRLLTLEYLFEGDLTAGGTLGRITIRSPRVMAVWRESPIIGWAFSSNYHSYADIHVANQTNLLNFGILGFIAITLIYFSIVLKTYHKGRDPAVKRSIENSSLVFVFTLLSLFFIHSTSGMLWGFGSVSHAAHLFWACLLAAINVELTGDRS
jgi:O-antigen ligase